MIAFMVSIVHMLFMAIYQPYRSIDNDYFTLACNFSLTSIFFFCVLLKVPVTSSLPLMPTRAAASPFRHPTYRPGRRSD